MFDASKNLVVLSCSKFLSHWCVFSVNIVRIDDSPSQEAFGKLNQWMKSGYVCNIRMKTVFCCCPEISVMQCYNGISIIYDTSVTNRNRIMADNICTTFYSYYNVMTVHEMK